MSTIHSDSAVRFYWLRESLPNQVEYDCGIRVAESDMLLALLGLHPGQRNVCAPSVKLDEVLAALSGTEPFESLPCWAQKRLAVTFGPLGNAEQRRLAARHAGVLLDVAGRILTCAPNGAEVEVHLPFLDRRDWSDRFEILNGAQFILTNGRVLPADLANSMAQMNDYNARWLAISALDPAAGAAALTFDHAQDVAGELAKLFLPVGRIQTVTDGPVRASVRMELPASACRAWNLAPTEGNNSYFPTYAEVSVAVQAALRRWIAYRWFTRLSRFEDTPMAYAVLAYLVSNPFFGGWRTEFTYDTLSEEWLAEAFHGVRPKLRNLLRLLRHQLAQENPKLVSKYQITRARDILDQVRKRRKLIHAIVLTEGIIVDQVVSLGADLTGATDVRAATHRAAAFADLLTARLRRFFPDVDLTGLSSMLMIEATGALSVALGGEPSICRHAEVRPAGYRRAAAMTSSISATPELRP
jgi:hypothetical protein